MFVCMFFTFTWLEHSTLCFVFLFQTLLPRGQNPNPLRDRNAEVNKLVHSKVSAVPKCEIVAIDKGFIQPDGTISHHDMHDYLHLTNSGYCKAFEPVYELLLQLLSEGETEKDLTPSEWIGINKCLWLCCVVLFIRRAQLLVENMTQTPEIYDADFHIKLRCSLISSLKARRMATCFITLILHYLAYREVPCTPFIFLMSRKFENIFSEIFKILFIIDICY